MSATELTQRDRFGTAYARSRAPVMQRIASDVCGCEIGGTSWTTQDEADWLIQELELKSGRHLLDLGAGAGWPSLYLAEQSGCQVTLLDLPDTGLDVAEERAQARGLLDQTIFVAADAADPPLPDAAFDAVSHSDLLCCLPEKRAVLESCRRLIRSNGKMAFSVIYVPDGLSSEDRRSAIENGPDFIEAETDYPSLLHETGWDVLINQDVSIAYYGACYRQMTADGREYNALCQLLGRHELDQRLDRWRRKLDVILQGLTRRALFLAKPRQR